MSFRKKIGLCQTTLIFLTLGATMITISCSIVGKNRLNPDCLDPLDYPHSLPLYIEEGEIMGTMIPYDLGFLSMSGLETSRYTPSYVDAQKGADILRKRHPNTKFLLDESKRQYYGWFEGENKILMMVFIDEDHHEKWRCDASISVHGGDKRFLINFAQDSAEVY